MALLSTPNGDLIAGSAHGVYRQIGADGAWVHSPFIADPVGTLARVDRGVIFAGTESGLYLSGDGGAGWELAAFGGMRVRVFAPGAGHLVLAAVGPGSDLYRSLDAGVTWARVPVDPPRPFTAMTIDRRGVLHAVGGLVISRSADSGSTWETVELLMIAPEVPTPPLSAIVVDTSGTILAGNEGTLILRSTDGGDTWDNHSAFGATSFLVTSDGALLAGTPGRGVMRSIDGGLSWSQLGLERRTVRALAERRRGGLYAGTTGRGVFRSRDNGGHWLEKNNGIIESIVNAIVAHRRQTVESFVLAATAGGIFRTDNGGAIWTLTAFDGEPVTRLVAAGDGSLYAAGMYPRSIARSTDNGSTWDRIDIPQSILTGIGGTLKINAISPGSGSLLLVSAGYEYSPRLNPVDGDLFRTEDFGQTWERVIEATDIASIVQRTDDIFAGGNGVFRSTDRGVTWERRDAGLPLSRITAMHAMRSGEIIAATADSGLFRSSDNGILWRPVTSFTGGRVTALLDWRSRTYLATAGDGIFSTDSTLTGWTAENRGLSNRSVLSLEYGISGPYAGTDGSGVFTADVASSVSSTDGDAGIALSIAPNPVNEFSLIRYTLATRGDVHLTLVDALGQVVRSIDETNISPGAHSVALDAEGLPSGIYHLRLDGAGATKEVGVVVAR